MKDSPSKQTTGGVYMVTLTGVLFGLFVVFFSYGMIVARTRRQVIGLALAGALAVALASPPPVQAQASLVAANRSMLLAIVFGALAMASLGFAIYVRVQPPTVIRVDSSGNAFAVSGPRGGRVTAFSLSADASSSRSASWCCAYRSLKDGLSCANFSPAISPTRQTRSIETWPRL